MILLSTLYSNDEKELMKKYCGEQCIILPFIENKIFLLNDYGTYYYNDCFEKAENKFINNQKYIEIIPIRALRFFHFYLFEAIIEDNTRIWCRGRLDTSGNYDCDSYSDTLEEMFDTL